MSHKRRITPAEGAASQAPLDYQFDLEDAIAAAKRNAQSRTQFMRAAQSARDAHAAKASAGELRTTYRTSLIEAFSIGRQKAEERRRRKNAKADTVDNRPTPERTAKMADGYVEGAAVKHYTVASPVDKYKAVLPEELVQAARQLVHDFLLAESSARVTPNYEGAPSTARGARHGGVPDYVREAQATVSLIRAEWHPAFVADVEWFLAQTVLHDTGAAIKLEDAGRQISPWKPNSDKDTAIGFGGLYKTLCLASRFYARQRALGKSPHPATSEDARRLLSEVRARAQARREREQKRLTREGR